MKKSIFLYSMSILLLTACSQSQQDKTESETGNESSAVEVSDSNKLLKSQTNEKTMYPQLSTYIESVLDGLDAIPQERKAELNTIAKFVQKKKEANEEANLTFICTHNSRRSHMSQIWASTAAAYYGIDNGIKTYSGGTEATAFNPRAVAAIERAGFSVVNPGGDNPLYKVKYNESAKAMDCFSKTYDDASNPQENFVAVLTCSDADQNCPFIPGASLRVPIPYDDPKASDGTDEETAAYDERCKQIATEMFYIMSQVKV